MHLVLEPAVRVRVDPAPVDKAGFTPPDVEGPWQVNVAVPAAPNRTQPSYFKHQSASDECRQDGRHMALGARGAVGAQECARNDPKPMSQSCRRTHREAPRHTSTCSALRQRLIGLSVCDSKSQAEDHGRGNGAAVRCTAARIRIQGNTAKSGYRTLPPTLMRTAGLFPHTLWDGQNRH